MARSNSRKTRTEQANAVARKAAQAAAAAVLEAAEDEEDDEEMDESIQPGDDGRPKTMKNRSMPAAGGPAKDVKLGSEGPDSVSKSRVQEQSDEDEMDDDDEMEESRLNPLGRFLNLEDHDDDEDDDDDMQEAAADDQLTRTDDSARLDAQRKRQSSTYSGDIGNEVTEKSHPAVPAGTAVVEAQMMAGEQPRGAAAPNPGSPGDQLTGSDGDTQADAKRAGQRGDPGTGGKPSSGALDAAQSAKERPIDPAAVGMDQTVAEATNALFNGEDLSEEFKTKASTIFGAALREVVQRHASNMTETYNGYLSEKVAEVQEHYEAKHGQLVERIDDYLGYVVEQWVSENKLAVETGLRADISDSFMKALHGIFKEHYIELPEDRVDAFTESQNRISELESQLGEQINSNVSLRKELSVKTVDEVFAEESDGLADTERERLRHLCEGVEFDDASQYRQKVQILRENYFTRATVAATNNADDVDEINTPSAPKLEGNMSKYVQGMNRLAGSASATGKFPTRNLNG